MKDDIRFKKGSDNIFKDLGLKNPGERLAKARAAESSVGMAELMNKITEDSDRQAQDVEQIDRAVAQTNEMTQQNAATAEESATSSEEMNTQAFEMKGFAEMLTTMVEGTGKRKYSEHRCRLRADCHRRIANQ